jgi:hypothetical protein
MAARKPRPALTRDAILAAEDLRREPVPVPEWGGTVYVRTMTGTERDAWEMMAFTVKDGEASVNRDNIRARLAALTVCDETGELLFSVDDIDALGKKSAPALDRVYAVAQRVNAVSAEDIKELSGN